MCWRLGLHPLFWILYTNCVDLVKLTPESSLRSAPSGIYVPVWSCFFHGRCVFSLAQESPEKSKKLCSRWTESDRGRERCTEALDKAAGQWGRQKLIREAASFTTPQLDHVCVFVCVSACAAHPLAMTPAERCICWSACVCVYLPAWDIAGSLFSPPPFGSLAQINHTLISISEQTTLTEHAVNCLRSLKRPSIKVIFGIMNSWGSGEYSWMVSDLWQRQSGVFNSLLPLTGLICIISLPSWLGRAWSCVCSSFLHVWLHLCHLNMIEPWFPAGSNRTHVPLYWIQGF